MSTVFDTAQTDLLLSTTRAVRRRLDLERPVDPAVIHECLQLAIQAPTASNGQTWRWMVVTDPDKRAEIARLYAGLGADYLPKMAAKADDPQTKRVYESAARLTDTLARVPVHVIPCVQGPIDLGSNGTAAAAYGSILPATWSFQLALRSRGLGSVFTTLHLFAEREVADLLGMGDGITQVGLLPVAYTIGTDFKPAARASVADITYWDTWGETR